MGAKGIFLGFENGMKGYKVHNLKDNKVVVSRNVKFYEHVFPFDPNNSDCDVFQIPNIGDDVEPHQDANKRSVRKHRQPAYLQYYHCALLQIGKVPNEKK